jgi:hypothetical protein
VVSKLADNQMGKKPYIRLALGNRMIRHGCGNGHAAYPLVLDYIPPMGMPFFFCHIFPPGDEFFFVIGRNTPDQFW